MQDNIQRYEEDKIDLRELWKTLVRRKGMIAGITGFVTLLAISYSLLKTPMYEAKALIEVGNYKLLNNNNNNNNNKVLLDNVSQLEKKLNILFIDVYENLKNRESEISSITVPKKQDIFLEVKALAISNKKAKQEIEKLVEYLKMKHQEILSDVKTRRELDIRNIDIEVNDIKTKEVKLLDDKIALLEKNINMSEKEIILLNKDMKNINNSNSAFIALQLMQKRDLVKTIAIYSDSLIDLENKKNILESTTINKLLENKALLMSMLLPYNYKNTEVVGEIMVNDNPAKPKKKLIVVVAFITGLMLSIFMAFFLEFIKGTKKEEVLL